MADRVGVLRPDVKILLMSGYSADALASAGHTADEVNLLTTPVTRSAVGRRVSAALAGKK